MRVCVLGLWHLGSVTSACLASVGQEHGMATPLFAGVRLSNKTHKGRPQRRLERLIGDVHGQTIVIWGLAYKAGDTHATAVACHGAMPLACEGRRNRAGPRPRHRPAA